MNILFITADQWRGDCTGYAGHPLVRTPNLDALAAEGTAFLAHYAQAAPCSPARAGLYTGLYQMNHRVVTNGTPLADRFDNVARAARRAGYEPTLFGYTDISPDPTVRHPRDPDTRSYEGVLPGFTVRVRMTEREKAWLSWLRLQGLELHDHVRAHLPVGVPPGTVGNAPPAYAAEQTQTAFLAGEFLRWLGEQDAPWFAHVSLLRPHPPFIVPAPYNTMFDPADVGGFVHADRNDHPFEQYARETTRKASFIPGASGLVRDLTDAELRQIRATYFGMIAEVDAQVGRMLQAVRDAGQWDETLVVFTSDHAEMMGDHRMLGKGGHQDGSQHIPLIIRMPGRAPEVIRDFTESIDLFPTLCAAMKVAPAHVPDGRPLFDAPRRDAVHWEFDFRDIPGQEPEQAMGQRSTQLNLAVIRTAAFKYVHFAALPPLLFDLHDDPHCLRNVADEPRYAAARLAMAERLLAWRAEHLDQTLALSALTDDGIVTVSR